MKVVIVGGGIGGLVCAIACRRENLEVVLLERAPALAPIGAGIQVPPNASRIARQLGYLPKLMERSILLDSIEYVRYDSGKVLYDIKGGTEVVRNFGDHWMVISRPDYHDVLWSFAKDLGVDLRLGCEMEAIDFDRSRVQLVGGEVVEGDVVIGADGLWSVSRNEILGRDSPAEETGDMAYRAVMNAEQLRALGDESLNVFLQKKSATCWMGPGRHCVLYPLDGGEQYNLVLIQPDDLDKSVRQAPGDLDKMRASFEGWDPRLVKMLSTISSALRWKLCHHKELEQWSKGSVALLGDACHPTLPYQAQGAAMAVEDGAVLGKLLGLLNASSVPPEPSSVAEILRLYEGLRKHRTSLIVQGADSNRQVFHFPDGPLQESRDAWLSGKGPKLPNFTFADHEYLTAMLHFDSVADCTQSFREWEKRHGTVANL